MGIEDVSRDIDLLKPELKKLVDSIYSNIIIYNRLPFEVFECKRTLERQEHLFKNGYSKTMNSRHLDGSAVDFVFRFEGKWSWDNNVHHYYKFLGGRVVELYGEKLEWGGNWSSFVDLPHFQLKN